MEREFTALGIQPSTVSLKGDVRVFAYVPMAENFTHLANKYSSRVTQGDTGGTSRPKRAKITYYYKEHNIRQ